MLEVTTSTQELILGVDFTEIYKNSTYTGDSNIGYLNALWYWNVIYSHLNVHHASLNLLLKLFPRCGICFRRNKDLIKELSQPTPGSKDLYFPTQYSQSFFTQCMACLWKQRWSYWRNPPYTAVRFFFTTFIALMFGTMFWDLGTQR